MTTGRSDLLQKESSADITARISKRIDLIPEQRMRSALRELASSQNASIAAIETTPPADSRISPIPQDLPEALISALNKIGVSSLYSHQIEALQAIREGKDIIVSTPTASGKTLCYNPAIVEACLKDRTSTALYIFPLKALAADQTEKLARLTDSLPHDQRPKTAIMTGDVPLSDRPALFSPTHPRILIVSPDLLHHQLYKTRLQEWENWKLFLKNLRFIIVDEAHTYVGAFGIHFANLIRRLLNASDRCGGDCERIQFVFSSATIGNPAQTAMRLTGRESSPERLRLIDKNGSGSAGTAIVCFEPVYAPNPDICRIIAALLKQDLTAIVFCNSRYAVKNLLYLIQNELKKSRMLHLQSAVAGFYGSILSERRREIIERVQSGEVKIVISTSALEAGLDLPELDCCIIRGYPGSLMSFRQRMGRAGRRRYGLGIFVPLAAFSLDYYYGMNPERLICGEAESSSFNPDYPAILAKHIECAGVEAGVETEKIEKRFGERSRAAARILCEQGKLSMSKQRILYGSGYPHKNVLIRGNQMSSVALIDKETGEAFEEMSVETAYREAFPKAVYAAQDEDGSLAYYRSESLDLEKGRAVMARCEKNPDLITQPIVELTVTPDSALDDPVEIETSIENGRIKTEILWGEINLQSSGYKLFRRFYGRTCLNFRCSNHRKSVQGSSCGGCSQKTQLGDISEQIDQEIFAHPYRSIYRAPITSLRINEELKRELSAFAESKRELIGIYGSDIPREYRAYWNYSASFIALHALEHLINAALPLLVLSSHRDMNGLCAAIGKDDCAAYLFDAADGGNGAAEAVFERFGEIAERAKHLAGACDCEAGCPRCLMRHGCCHDNDGLEKSLGMHLLKLIVP